MLGSKFPFRAIRVFRGSLKVRQSLKGISGGALRDHRLGAVTPPGLRGPVGSRPSRYRDAAEGDRWACDQAAIVAGL